MSLLAHPGGERLGCILDTGDFTAVGGGCDDESR
jgi:hypothetical protein